MNPLATTAERAIIVNIEDGIANTLLVHLPATRCNKGGFRFADHQFPPNTWPPACGQFRSGSVYIHAGAFKDSRVCPECAVCV